MKKGVGSTTKKLSIRYRVASIGAVVCLTTTTCVLATSPASSAPFNPEREVAAAQLAPSASSAHSHTAPTTTSTTVMGGGSPSTWPAAKKVAPSLAGAYSTNPTTAFLALVKYSDWVGSHPDPNLVQNYAIPTSNIYRNQVYLMQQLVKRGWHISPQPTKIDFLKTALLPITKTLANGSKYQGDAIETVIDEQKSPYLNRAGKLVGRTEGGGPTAYVVTLVQARLHGQFYIDVWEQVSSLGNGITWERQLEARQ